MEPPWRVLRRLLWTPCAQRWWSSKENAENGLEDGLASGRRASAKSVEEGSRVARSWGGCVVRMMVLVATKWGHRAMPRPAVPECPDQLFVGSSDQWLVLAAPELPGPPPQVAKCTPNKLMLSRECWQTDGEDGGTPSPLPRPPLSPPSCSLCCSFPWRRIRPPVSAGKYIVI